MCVYWGGDMCVGCGGDMCAYCVPVESQSVTSQLPRVTSSVAVSTSATLTTVSASTSSRRDLSSTSPGFSWQEVGRTKV